MVQEAGQFLYGSAPWVGHLHLTCVCLLVQQSQSNASAVVQSEAEPRQVRGRWAEQTDPVIICSDFSPSGVREGDEEKDEEEEFHPQSLEELLVEEEEDNDEKQVGSVTSLITGTRDADGPVTFRLQGNTGATSSTPPPTTPASTATGEAPAHLALGFSLRNGLVK